MIKPLSVFFACFFIFIGNLAFADIDMSGVYAYPVPFNPKKSPTKVIKFNDGPTLPPTPTLAGTVKMEVFDINGDMVITRTFASLSAAQWNARTEKGRLVSPGMYIIKLSVNDEATGNFGKKNIRVLIAY